MVEVKSICGMCLETRTICPVCYPDIKSAKALHEEMAKGFFAHCESCHKVFLKMDDEFYEGIVIPWRDK